MKRMSVCFLAVMSLLVVGAWAADEACPPAETQQCSRQIAVTDVNSQVRWGFSTQDVCVFNDSSSANTLYVKWTNDPAIADPDESHPIKPNESLCLGEGRRLNEVNLIAAAGETATAQVLALRAR